MSMRNEIPYTVELKFLSPREPFAIFFDRVSRQEDFIKVDTPQTERLELNFEIPFEEDLNVNYYGTCECDRCKESDHPVELYRGMTVFAMPDGKLIYCDCLQEYLNKRKVTLK